jgi:hypothetical protein
VSTPGTVPVADGRGSPVEVVRRFNAAWAAHDLAVTSRAAWQPIFDDLASTFTVEETIEAGPRVVQRWRYDWAGGHVRGVDIFTVKDEQITEKVAYVKG